MRLRVFIFVLVLLALWWLLQIPRVMTAILLFSALGVNPFTGRSIEPTTMVELLSGLLAISIVVLFRKEWLRVGRWLFGHRAPTPAPMTTEAEAAIAEPMPTPTPAPLAPALPLALPSQAVAYNPQSGTTIPGPTFTPLPQLQSWALPPMPRLVKPKKRILPSIRPVVRYFAYKVRRGFIALNAGINFAWATTRPAAGASRVKLISIGRGITAQSRHTWWLSEPYIRRFDAWIARKLHQYDTSTALLDVGREMERLTRQWLTELRALRRNPAITDLLRAWRK